MKNLQLSPELEAQIDGLVSEGRFPSFQTAVDELVRLGLAMMKRGGSGTIPPGQIPAPERPISPDPSRDILQM